jgi:hypothetical protein
MSFPGNRLAARIAALFTAVLGLAAAMGAEEGFFSPARGTTLAAASTLEVVWSAPCADRSGTSETELVLSLDGGLTFPVRVSSEMGACAKSFRWQVPALETAHARLALRAGAGEGSESERLELVSEEFAIVVGEADDAEVLIQGARELWTAQAVSGAGDEELPFESMAGGTSERLVSPEFWTEISNPDRQGATAPPASGSSLAKTAPLSVPTAARLPAGRGTRPTPLRL